VAAVQPLYRRPTGDLIYDYALSSSYRSSWVFDPSFTLEKPGDIWETVRNDVGFLSSFDRHARGVVKPWHVSAPKKSKDDKDKQLAGIVEDAVGQIRQFNSWRRIQSEAAFLGRRYGFIESERKSISLDGLPEMDWIVPTFIKDVDRRRFHWVAEEDWKTNPKRPTRSTHLSFYNSVTTQWEDVSPEFRMALIESVFYNTEDRIGYGRGWLESIYYAHYMKSVTIEKIAQGIDRWANGIWIFKLDSLRNASTSKTNEDLKDGAKTLMRNMRSEHIAVLNDGDEVEVQETTGGGHNIGMEFVSYWDEAVERLCNGSIRPSGHATDKSGAKAASETESDSSEAFYQDEREERDDDVDRDLIGWFLKQPLNRANLMKLTLSEAKRPKFSSEQQKREDPLIAVQVGQGLQQMGFPIVLKELADKTGFSVAGPDDEVLEFQQGQDFAMAENDNAAKQEQIVAKEKAQPKPAARK
jgi:hypothetical protein